MAGMKMNIREVLKNQKQEFFQSWVDFRAWIKNAWLDWLCDASFHQGEIKATTHDHRPNTTISYCSRCKQIIDEFEYEKGVSWTSETH